MQIESPARARFVSLLERPVPPLDEAALAIAAEEYADLDPAASLAELDRLAALVRRRTASTLRASATLRALREVIFEDEHFRGNERDYYDARNSYLNQVLERRLGIPISLSIVLMEVARRAGLRLDGVGFPGHFLVKLVPEAGPDVFVDAYNGGELLSGEECVARFKNVVHGREFDPSWLQAVPPRQILSRMLHNLKRIYVEQGDDVRAYWVVDRLHLLAPDDADELRDRGLVAARLGLKPAAARDLEAYLAKVPSAADGDEVRELLGSLKARPALLN